MTEQHRDTEASCRLRRPFHTLSVVVAHPDDEILFFLGWMQSLPYKRLRLVCVTGDFGAQTDQRRAEFEAVGQALGAETIILGLEDSRAPQGDRVGRHLDLRALRAGLATLEHHPTDVVLTHDPMGEYGHAHHVDVFREAARCFGQDLWCSAGPLEVHIDHDLGTAGAAKKSRLIHDYYPSQQGINGWASGYEALCHVASSRFAPLFVPREYGRDGFDTSPNAESSASLFDCATSFVTLLANRYVGPDRELPRVAQTVERAWAAPQLDWWYQARIADWYEWLGVGSARTQLARPACADAEIQANYWLRTVGLT